MMRFCVLGSGSKGNATFVEAGKTRMLIDAGFSGREIERRLATIGIATESLSAILITHEHGDHIAGAGILSRRYRLPVFANQATLTAAGPVLAKLHQCCAFVTGEGFSFGDFAIHPYRISHDSADPVGFLLTDGHCRLGYCTDTGTVSRLMEHRLADCHGLVLEANHDPVLLANGPYPPALQQRVRSRQGHLANDEAADFLKNLLHLDLKHVVLSHLSETNNRPEIAQAAIAAMLADCGRKRGADWPLPAISMACQDQVGELVCLG